MQPIQPQKADTSGKCLALFEPFKPFEPLEPIQPLLQTGV